jgi:hypothetical protein
MKGQAVPWVWPSSPTPAFEGKLGIKAYNSVQAVKRALTRVQLYVLQLSESGAMIAGF